MVAKRRPRCLRLAVAFFFLCLFMGPKLAQAQSLFSGSVSSGKATGSTMELSLEQAFQRALKYNLGVIESEESARAARAVRLRRLNALLPDLSARVSALVEQENLRSRGINISIPGVAVPRIVGPFGVADARVHLSQEIFNWSDIEYWKSSGESEKASQYSYRHDRDLVTFAAGSAYLLVISDSANLDSIRAQVGTAQTLYHQAVDQNTQGVIANIDVLRAQVELQTQQQRLIAAESQLAIDKLTLARVIGLPNGQEFELTDSVPYVPLDGLSVERALAQAYATRPDYRSAEAQVRAAQLSYEAAVAENYPSLSTEANYGDIGSPNFGTSHGTFSVALGLNIPIFQGSRVRADKLQADSRLQQRMAELADLGGKIDDEVRTAFYKLKSSSELVSVARSNVDLANRTLMQAQDRFRAGVADNLEVVQAQESVALANQSYVASLYSFNAAKLSLAEALGIAEQSALKYLLGEK